MLKILGVYFICIAIAKLIYVGIRRGKHGTD